MKTKEELIKFEEDVVEMYKQGKLRSPIHLSGSVDGKLEDFLIELFKEIKPSDWVFSTYRSHYHALLKGIPEDWLKQWILDNKSIHVMNSQHKFITSAIVGGTIPVALGVALGIKLKQAAIADEIKSQVKAAVEESGYELEKEIQVEPQNLPHVWCFIGDMTASLGIFKDALLYASANDLPITFVIEDNGLSTDTHTSEAWGYDVRDVLKTYSQLYPEMIKYIQYVRTYPHYGCGVFVDFKEDIKQDGSNF